jgi:predicted dehydrogenase
MHNWTQAPILLRATEEARSGRLGALAEVELVTLRTQPAAAAGDAGNWRIDPARAGGGILFDHGWHGMSILLRAVGASPETVQGRVEKRRHLSLSVEDTSETLLRFPAGVRGRFEATWAADERANRGRFRCADGEVEVENDLLRIRQHGRILSEERFAESLAGGGYRPGWTAGIAREFRREIETPSARGRSLEEALTCLRLVMATYASAEAGSSWLPA